ncbi:NCS cytosine-purine permease [Dichomitus squalens LYAD-421 SS1]|uniref:NCS cytosine-purine permease n=1 Tax=Dichomitus squalens TaxID=114155 RepID=A0A4Q9Q1T8_9APHY|nr:NCS cytosine-purine permease [Dichomitus squalens LYAD-421 SS1]EJF63789.1 NCS cytosine-purine permease [Dichomitus squalens LYAD-421 SS1]TBU61173.1 NCS cytosine-purine permease [Dichomitus squalens]
MADDHKFPVADVEKDSSSVHDYTYAQRDWHYSHRWTRRALQWGLETRGITPVAERERIDTQYSKIFFIWLSANFNILSFSAGTLGPVIFGLGLRDSCLVILFFNLLCSALPAYLSTWGPKLGLRQMCQARYSFGYFGVIVPSVFNCCSMMGFCILNCILGGQTLASITDGRLSWSVGIVVVAVISLLVSFCGYRVLNWYERLAWVPVLVVYLVALGVGGKHIRNPPPAEPATAQAILSFAGTIAGFVITYASLGSDFTIYYTPSVPSWTIFLYSYLGFNIPIILLQCLGAAVVLSAPSVPAWNEGYANGNVGGLIEAMLQPTGNFGKFLTVLMALSVTANIAPTFYSFSLSFQVFIPPLAVIPRYMFSILATAILIPISIVGAHKFYDTLTNFLGLIGYWASAFGAVVLVEHLLIRRGDFASYDLHYWNDWRRLPTGLAALGACLLSCALIIPSMDQVWFVGPIAQRTGDIGFELAFASAGLFYVPLRYLELRFRPLV